MLDGEQRLLDGEQHVPSLLASQTSVRPRKVELWSLSSCVVIFLGFVGMIEYSLVSLSLCDARLGFGGFVGGASNK